MRRIGRFAHSPLPASNNMRLASMVVLLLLIGMLYQRARDPNTWKWLEEGVPLAEAPAPLPVDAPAPQTATKPADVEDGQVINPGPTGQDEEQRQLAQEEFDVLADHSPLVSYEMFAYWRCLRWANAETFAALDSRARRDIPMTALFEQPEKFRGELVRLRLNISRVLEYDAPENSAGVSKVYEAWGTTEESKSYPYVVVFSKLPAGLQVGTNVRGRGIFVGYFVKYMAYTAVEKRRSAPLLVGRMMPAPRPVPVAEPVSTTTTWVIGVLCGLAIAGFAAWWVRSRRHKGRSMQVAGPLDEMPPPWTTESGAGPSFRAIWPDQQPESAADSAESAAGQASPAVDTSNPR